MRTSDIGSRKRLVDCAQLVSLVALLLSSPAAADFYPINGVWIATNPAFPIGVNEACFALRLSGIRAVVQKSITELVIFNDNKRYDVKQNGQSVSTLSSIKPSDDGHWVTELGEVRSRFWFRPKTTYLLTIIDPTTIEIRSNSRRTKFIKCESRGKLGT